MAELVPSNESTDIRQIVAEEVKKYKSRFIQAAILYAPILFLVWIVPYVDELKPLLTFVPVWRGNPLYAFLLLVPASVIQFHMGGHFYSSAFKSLKHGSANMDVLIVISTTAAYLYGLILLFIGYSEEEMESDGFAMLVLRNCHNWETSAILIVIIVLGKYLEAFSKMKTVSKLSDLASLKVTKANLVKEADPSKVTLGSAFTEIPVELLEKKDLVLV